MAAVIDVLAMLKEKRLSLMKEQTSVIDYTKKNDQFTVARFIFECGIKLDMHPLTISSAAYFYHRFLREPGSHKFDPYLIASTCLLIAGKVRADHIDIRDVMNVSYHTLHRGSPCLELGIQYWNMENAINQTKELIMRLNLKITPDHAYKYLLHYLRALQVWIGEEEWSKYPVARTSMAFLQDFYHSSDVLDVLPKWLAIACINLSLQVYGVVVPLLDECDNYPWFNIFSKDLTTNKLWEVMEKIMSLYDEEPELKNKQ